MKNVIIKKVCIISCLMIGSVGAQPASKPLLTSSIIKWLDNKPYALDPEALKDILHGRREIRKIQYGVPDPLTKKFVGFYLFDGELRTLRWLADYERAITKDFIEQKAALDAQYVNMRSFNDEMNSIKTSLNESLEASIIQHCDHIKRSIIDQEECEYQLMKIQRELTTQHEQTLTELQEEVIMKHISNKAFYQRELKVITDAYQTKIKALIPCLKMAIRDFVIANEPFALKMQGTKTMMLKLVEEFCLKYRRPYSFLLEWSNVDEGQEVIVFQRKMTSCRALDEFCTDLTDFLESLYYSCEKARAALEAQEHAKRK